MGKLVILLEIPKSVLPLVFCMDVGSVRQQKLNDGHPVVASCKMQRRRVPTIHVPAVDDVGEGAHQSFNLI